MELTLPAWALFLTGLLALCGAIIKLFEKADEVASPTAKERAAAWIRNTQESFEYSWPTLFKEAFDGIFGKKLWSLDSYAKSSCAPLAIGSIFFLLELLSNLVYDHQAAFLSDWSSTSIPS